LSITDELTWHPAKRPAADSSDPRQADRVTAPIRGMFVALPLTARWGLVAGPGLCQRPEGHFFTAASLAVSLHSSHTLSIPLWPFAAGTFKISGMRLTPASAMIAHPLLCRRPPMAEARAAGSLTGRHEAHQSAIQRRNPTGRVHTSRASPNLALPGCRPRPRPGPAGVGRHHLLGSE
jgi:hypothetical protein